MPASLSLHSASSPLPHTDAMLTEGTIPSAAPEVPSPHSSHPKLPSPHLATPWTLSPVSGEGDPHHLLTHSLAEPPAACVKAGSDLESQQKPSVPVMDQHTQLSPPHTQSLTFFQQYFTKPVDTSKDPEKYGAAGRRFSLLSMGSLIAGAILLLTLFGVIAAAIATTINDHHEIAAARGAIVSRAIPANFPDPSLLYDNGTWYAFGTNNAAGVLPYHHGNPTYPNAQSNTPDWGRANIQMATSTNFVNWTMAPLDHQPLPNTGQWSQFQQNNQWVQPRISNTWAPAVTKIKDGHYVMYYSSAIGVKNPYIKPNGFNYSHPVPHCIGVATSNGTGPAGPYIPVNSAWVCPWQQGGAIDPEVIRDSDGTLYLVYKVDGNNIGSGGECGNTFGNIKPTPIMLQKLGPDGTELIGSPQEILTNDGPGDGPLVEAPMLIRSSEGIYFLFFSSGCTRAPSYNTKYATATSIAGPYTRQGVFLETGYWGLEGPGSIGIAADGLGGWNLAFQARMDYGDIGRVRSMFTSKVLLSGHTATIIADNSTVHLDRQKR